MLKSLISDIKLTLGLGKGLLPPFVQFTNIFSACYKQWETLILGAPKITADGDCIHEIKRRLLLGRKAMTNLDSILKSRDITLPTKVCLAKAMVFPIVMYGCKSLRNCVPKNWCFWTVVLEKTLESPLDCKEIQPVHPKGDQSWVFIGRTDAEAETPVLWPPDVKKWFIWKDPNAGEDWGGERKGGEGDGRGWDGWMASPTQWTWVWASSGSWWSTGKPGVLQSMGSQRVGHNRASELNIFLNLISEMLALYFIFCTIKE